MQEQERGRGRMATSPLTPSDGGIEIRGMKRANAPLNRRHFIKTSALTAGLVGLPKWFADQNEVQAATRPLGPNDRPGIGLIGCGGQGRGVCNWARGFGDVIAVCDVDDGQADQAQKQFNAPHRYHDFRQLLERDDIHVIVNGTPDHWHTMVNIAAARAGKDIYSEKPLTLTIAEGRDLVAAIRKHQRILQVGSQQRSESRFRLACELVRNGRIGKLQHMLVGLPTGPREGPFKPQPVPHGMNWDWYLGPTPYVPYNGRNAHWNFRWWYQFSGGQMTDWGAHHNDIAQWGNGTERSGPVSVDGKSLVDMIPGGYDAASQYIIRFKYANGVDMTVRSQDITVDFDRDNYHPSAAPRRIDNGVWFHGTDGWIFVTRGKIEASNPDLLETPLPDNAVRLYRSDNHMANFFESVRSRKDPICDVEIGHRSISTAHLGVISIRLNRALRWNPEKEDFVGDAEASACLARPLRAPYDESFIG